MLVLIRSRVLRDNEPSRTTLTSRLRTLDLGQLDDDTEGVVPHVTNQQRLRDPLELEAVKTVFLALGN
jgi:hypothetical protein